ncbi:MAG TPA: AraC family transcriptional regulator, partial [Puia sp.]
MKRANFEKIEPAEGSSFHMAYNKAPFLCHQDFWHFHPEFEIVYVPHGNGKRFVGDKISGFADGDLVLLGPDIPHNAFNFGFESEGYEEYVIQFRREHINMMTDRFPEFSRIARLLNAAETGIAITGEAKHRIGQLIREMRQLNCFQRLMQLFLILREMSLFAQVEDLEAKKFLSVDTMQARRIGMVYQIIQKDYQQELSTRQVAGALAMTESSFCRWFKHVTGKSFKQALTEVRIQKACALLIHSDHPVGSVASMSGFNNVSLFNRMFKSIARVTPNKYRRSMGVKMTIASLLLAVLLAQCAPSSRRILDEKKIAATYFGEDSAWYLDNIPFFECSDQQMEQVYYYRWKLYKAHIRNTGHGQYVITEFINHVSWDRDPYCTINAASMHHIYEGRWLRDPRYV